MKNVVSYVEKYGDMTFKEKGIGEIDYAILSMLSYLNYDGVLSSDNTKTKLNDALNIIFKRYTNSKTNFKRNKSSNKFQNMLFELLF